MGKWINAIAAFSIFAECKGLGRNHRTLQSILFFETQQKNRTRTSVCQSGRSGLKAELADAVSDASASNLILDRLETPRRGSQEAVFSSLLRGLHRLAQRHSPREFGIERHR